VARGRGRIGGTLYEIIDTPGMYSLVPITEEERVARQILLHERPACVLHVIDAKNAARMIPLTLQLIEAGLPVVLVANMMDEAERIGMIVDTDILASRLGVPVVPTVATTGRGLGELRREIQHVANEHHYVG
ncbi:MAG: FeoB small GTPase domain-containing protein, partial [Armatimonadota bacterium]